MAEVVLEKFTSDSGEFEIKPDMIISEVIDTFPRVAGVFMSYGLHCVGCTASAFDTVWDGAKIHGMPDEEINRMIADSNAIINKKIETIELTEKANSMVKELRSQEKGKEDWPLRVKIDIVDDKFVYDMDFDKKKDDDTELDFSGLTVLIGPETLPNLKGSIIDYVDSMAGSGFKIDNPNKPSCACGKNSSCGCGSGGCGH